VGKKLFPDGFPEGCPEVTTDKTAGDFFAKAILVIRGLEMNFVPLAKSAFGGHLLHAASGVKLDGRTKPNPIAALFATYA
jgi:hypothetical protein